MTKNPDAYLLYEYMEKIPYTVRIKVKLNEKIDGKLLYDAAQEAANRLPYFSVKVELDKEENYTIVHNDAPITVCPEDEKKGLFSARKRSTGISSL